MIAVINDSRNSNGDTPLKILPVKSYALQEVDSLMRIIFQGKSLPNFMENLIATGSASIDA